jgi:hypothetical protein
MKRGGPCASRYEAFCQNHTNTVVYWDESFSFTSLWTNKHVSSHFKVKRSEELVIFAGCEWTRYPQYWLHTQTDFLGAFTKLRKANISFVMSVRPSVPLSFHSFVCMNNLAATGGFFLWNLIFDSFSKICRQNSSFVTIWQEYNGYFA